MISVHEYVQSVVFLVLFRVAELRPETLTGREGGLCCYLESAFGWVLNIITGIQYIEPLSKDTLEIRTTPHFSFPLLDAI